MQALCFPDTNPNPLAAPWQFPSEWLVEAPEGYRDEMQVYTVTRALTAGQTVQVDLNTYASGQCNFYWRQIGVFVYGGAGVPAVRIRDSEGNMMSNTRIVLANDGAFGRQDHNTPLPIPHRMVPASRLTFDFQEVDNAAACTVVICVHGVNRWPADGPNDARGGAVGGGGAV